ncbi:hypothetical protein L208DRAFT_1414585 [Tricholoma matsutake]|nr:hypothetical protein L208DRAFT_1414585 [Tricholoma matsutake 945]
MPCRPQHYPPKALGSKQHTTHFQAHEQLLVGWIAGGILAIRGQTEPRQHSLHLQARPQQHPDPRATTLNDCWEWGGDDNNNDNHDHNYDGNSEAGRVHRDDTRREGNKGEQERGPGDLDVSWAITTQHHPQMTMPMALDPSATSNCS